MQYTLDKFNIEYTEMKTKLREMNLLALQFRCTKAVYSLAFKLDELIHRMNTKPEKYNDILESSKVFIVSIHESIPEFLETLTNTKTREEVEKSMDDFYVQKYMPLKGFIDMNQSLSKSFGFNSHYTGLNKKEVDAAFQEAINKVYKNRNTYNVFLLPGLCQGYLEDFSGSQLDIIIPSSSYFATIHSSADYYLFTESATIRSEINTGCYNQYLKRFIFGDKSNVKMSNSFDIGMMATDKYYHYFSTAIEEVDDNFKSRFLTLNFHVAVGGIEFIGIPKAFLNPYVLKLLNSYLENIQFITADKSSRFIIVAGNRRPKYSSDIVSEMKLMRKALNSSQSHTLLAASNVQSAKITFRSAIPDQADALRAIESNASFLQKFNHNVNKDLMLQTEESTRRNLLPFSGGQLSLILVSGRIDGVVAEGNGMFHAIKGSTYKTQNRSTYYDETGNAVEATTYATGTSVTMLTADGEFRDLK